MRGTSNWLILMCAGSLGLVPGCSDDGTLGAADTEAADTGGATDDPGATGPLPTTGSSASDTASGTASGTATSGPEDDDTATTGEGDGDGDSEDDGCPYGSEGCLCDVGATCDEGLDCVDGTCVAPPECSVEGEPNDDEQDAVELALVTCEDEWVSVDGGLDGDDTDWFMFTVDDLQGPPAACFGEQPRARVMADEDVAVCVFVACGEDYSPQSTCPFQQTSSTSPDGHPGCCGVNGASTTSHSCFSLGSFEPDPDKHFYVRVSSREEAPVECLPYTLGYGFFSGG